MKFISTIIILLLSYSNSAYSEWTDTVNESWNKTKEYSQEGWDKSKEYSQKGWDSTKSAWNSTSEIFSESEETRQKSRSDQEDERFRDMWSDVFGQLNEGLDIIVKTKTAPDSAYFSDDKESLRDDLDLILDKTLVLLEDESINDYRNKIEDLNQLIDESKGNVSTYREEKITAPRSSMVKTTKENYEKKIADEKLNIITYQTEIEKIKTHFKERLQDIGVDLSEEQIDILLARVDADDIIQMSVIFDVLKKITNQLMELTQESGEDLKQAKKYYGMHVVLLELVNHMQQKYIDKVKAVYIPKIDTIIGDTVKTKNDAKQHISEDSDLKRIAGFKNNITALNLTLKTAKLYRKNLKDQQSQVISAQQIVQKDLKLSQNTYDTVEVSSGLLSVLKESKGSFDALMSLQVPKIVQFKNLQMEKKYKELSKLLKT